MILDFYLARVHIEEIQVKIEKTKSDHREKNRTKRKTTSNFIKHERK